MKTNKTLIVLALWLATQIAIGQRTYDIRFVLDDLDCTANTVCYMTQLRSADGIGWHLAGQNYRIFYDGSMAEYIDESAESLLPDSQYFLDRSNLQDVQHVDASSFGFSLPFADDLSFLNYSIDLMSLSTGGVNLPGSGEWVSTSRLCFNVAEAATTDPNQCLELVWARMGKTDDYATAFVEVSQWVQSNSTTDALTNIYDDLDSEDSQDACLAAICDPQVMLEVTEEACTDGIDNDNDGLIDCQDDQCAPFCVSTATQYDITLDLATIDCVSGITCYDVKLKSAAADAFILGSQEYRLYYNSEMATYLLSQSQLSNAYQPLALQDGTPIENRNATGVGNLPYEGDLGYLSFSIQLADNAVGGDQIINSNAFTTVAQVCFTMTANVINDGAICFEADWARVGATDNYGAEVVMIEEWTAANEVNEASAASYNNLDATRGNDACFNLTCDQNNDDEKGDILCSDGVDNDDDGLVDCADPGCSTSIVCDSCNAQAPSLSGN